MKIFEKLRYNPDPLKREYIVLTLTTTNETVKVFIHWLLDKDFIAKKGATLICSDKHEKTKVHRRCVRVKETPTEILKKVRATMETTRI